MEWEGGGRKSGKGQTSHIDNTNIMLLEITCLTIADLVSINALGFQPTNSLIFNNSVIIYLVP